MAKKDFQTRGEDIFDDIAYSFDRVDGNVGRLRNNTRPCVPRYNFDTDDPGDKPLNPIEGQIAVGNDDNFFHYFVNGQWRSGVGGDWKTLPIESPWITGIPPYGTAEYMVLAEEYFFRGAIVNGTEDDLLAVLPVEDRPADQHRYVISRDYQLAFIEIYTNGNIFVKSASS